MPLEFYFFYQVVSLIYVYVIVMQKGDKLHWDARFSFQVVYLYMGIHVHGQIELP